MQIIKSNCSKICTFVALVPSNIFAGKRPTFDTMVDKNNSVNQINEELVSALLLGIVVQFMTICHISSYFISSVLHAKILICLEVGQGGTRHKTFNIIYFMIILL